MGGLQGPSGVGVDDVGGEFDRDVVAGGGGVLDGLCGGGEGLFGGGEGLFGGGGRGVLGLGGGGGGGQGAQGAVGVETPFLKWRP